LNRPVHETGGECKLAVFISVNEQATATTKTCIQECCLLSLVDLSNRKPNQAATMVSVFKITVALFALVAVAFAAPTVSSSIPLPSASTMANTSLGRQQSI
jgi:hypothetical protein